MEMESRWSDLSCVGDARHGGGGRGPPPAPAPVAQRDPATGRPKAALIVGHTCSAGRPPYELTAALSLSIIQSFADVERRYLKIRIALVIGCDGQRFGQRPVRSSSLIANGA